MLKSIDHPILLVENTLSVARIYKESLRREGYDVVLAENGKQAYAFLDRAMPQALILDLMLPDANGMEILQHVRKKYPELPVVVVTATNSVNVAVEAMQRGAFDFIVKPVSSASLITTLRNALEHKALADEVAELRQVVSQNRFHDFVGQSATMQAVYRIIDSVASSRASVFICDESGTGKKIAALAIHKSSPRRAKPFITLNCAAIPHDKIECQLFGHVKGAFPGAIEDLPGAILAANDGTLFLDEVCNLPLVVQAKLMHFLQTGEMTQVGSIKTETPDVRILAASSRDIVKLVHSGSMREDLYYRLHTIPVEMPALCEREDDIIMLAQHFLAKFNAEEGKNFTGLHPDVLSFLRRYDWPGKVRQLENVIRNITVLHAGPTVTPHLLPSDLRRFAETSIWPANQNSEELQLEEMPQNAIKPLWLSEKGLIEKALEATHNDINTAAALLQISPAVLYRKIHSWQSLASVA